MDRTKLAGMVLNDSGALAKLEAIVHPLVSVSSDKFLADAQARGAEVVVLDVPLLFESELGVPLRCRRGGLGAGGDSAPSRAWSVRV